MVDDESEEIFADKVGVIVACDLTYSISTLPPYAADEEKYDILARIVSKIENLIEFAGRKVAQVVTVNGVRMILDNCS